jgi:preprotein translocase subunit SecF
MLNIVGKRFWFFLVSGILILIAVVSLIAFKFTYSVDFSGGSLLTITFVNPVEHDTFVQKMSDLGYENSIIQSSGQNEFLIRTKEVISDEKTLVDSLTAAFGTLADTPEFESTPAGEASQTARNAAVAVGIAMIFMLIYVTYAFRKMPQPFRWGFCFTLALLHDILVTVGLFALFAHIFGWELDLMFITGILAIVGVSLDNTIVVFDRMRENQRNGVSPDFEVVVNRSQIETLGRSLNTSITILITLLALMLFVGGNIQNFVVVLMVGLIAGTFDSVFVAPGLLVVWDKNEWGRFIGRKKTTAPVKA